MIVSSRRRDRRRRLAGAHVLAFTNGYAFLFLVGGAVAASPRHFSRSREMPYRFVGGALTGATGRRGGVVARARG